MATPDVRVRLSAEGVQEVVDALRRIQAEAQKASTAATRSAAGAKSGFDGFGKAIAGVSGLLKAFGVVIAAGTLVELGRQAVDSADAVSKLRDRLGGTISDLSALSTAARLSRSSLVAVEEAMSTLARRVAELRTGDATSAEWFARIGLSARSFKGLALPQQLELVARGLQRVADDGDRAAVAQALLGKNVRELLPMLDQLGRAGLKGLRDQARSLGLLVDPRSVHGAQRLGDAFGVLGEQVKAFVTDFVGGIGTGAAGALENLSKTIGRALSSTIYFGQTAAGLLGRIFGQILGFVIGLVQIFTASTRLLFEHLALDASTIWRQATLAARGHFKEAWALNEEFAKRRRALNDEASKEITQALRSMFTLQKRQPGPSGAAASDTDLQQAFQLRAETVKSALENERRIHEAQLSLREKAEDASYQRALVSIRDHYAARRRLVEQSLTWEIAALVRQRALAAGNPDRGAGEREVRNIDSQIRARKIQAQAAFAELADREIADTRRAAETRLSYERKILDATGSRFESMLRGLEEEKRQYADVLRLQGLSTDEISRRVDEFERATRAAAIFEQARDEADTVMARFTSERARVQADVDAGVLTQLQGENRILALERQRLPGLQEMADALTRAAEATGDPEKIAQARQFADSLREMGRAGSAAEKSLQHLKAGFEDALRGGLTEFFTSGINEATSFAGAMQSMAASVVSALQRIGAEALALQILDWLKFIPGFSSGGRVKRGAHAAGGLLSGPGTGTSDSIPAWVSTGEYIVRAAAVAAPGMLAHLEEINRGIRPVSFARAPIARYADGGLVAGAALGAGACGSSQLTVGLEQGLVLREIKSPEGQRVIVESLARNRRAAGRVLGG